MIAAGGGFGDTLLASICVSALRSKYASVDAVVLPAHVDVFLHGTRVDRIFSAMQPPNELAAELRARKYAAAVVTWATAQTALLAMRSGARERVGQARRLYSPLFSKRVVVRSELGDTTTHWSEILLEYTRALGCETEQPWPVFGPREDEEAEAEALLRELGVSGEFMIVNPTSAAAPYRPHWPLEGWSEVVRRVTARYGLPVVLTGSPADVRLTDPMAAATGAHSAVGRTTFGVFAALARRARAHMGMHSAPMHIAAALGTPTVATFPLRVDYPDRWRPLGPRVAIVRPSYPCPPGRAHLMETCASFECVAQLEFDAIDRALERVLTNPQPSLREAA